MYLMANLVHVSMCPVMTENRKHIPLPRSPIVYIREDFEVPPNLRYDTVFCHVSIVKSLQIVHNGEKSL